MTKKNVYKRVIKLYYPALMVFLVFTFANNLLIGLMQNFCIDLLLYNLLWLFLAIQTTFAYVRIKEIETQDYSIKPFISDCIDVAIAVIVCAAIGSTYRETAYHELRSYLILSIPFMILAINQFAWFIMVRLFDIPAIFRICILFLGMLIISIFEIVHHDVWNLIAIVSMIVLLGVLRAINKAPRHFETMTTNIWTFMKNKFKWM